MEHATFSKFTKTSENAARKAGRIHLDNLDQSVNVRAKNASFDLVTESDLQAEKEIVALIRSEFPDHGFLAEENTYEKAKSDYHWIIDPLDGTNNFAFGIPFFAVSVALYKSGAPVSAAVYLPYMDEMFIAESGMGAYFNGKQIHSPKVESFEKAVLTTGFYYDRGKAVTDNLERIRRFFENHIVGIRRTGAAAMDLCYTACGRFTGFWEFRLSPWDFAAGRLIIEEAGGCITDFEGGGLPAKTESPVLAAGCETIRRRMQDILNL
ncbi:MAG: inositol monophosphatase [Desulfarculaceae bacterium]|nr:inositol monophosphatase [Desulfarculaceae bacterium]